MLSLQTVTNLGGPVEGGTCGAVQVGFEPFRVPSSEPVADGPVGKLREWMAIMGMATACWFQHCFQRFPKVDEC
jgi:hypothetical protein